MDTDLDLSSLTTNVKQPLNHNTEVLVQRFSAALARKLYEAQLKYGYADGWKNRGWEQSCRAEFAEHVNKGDPLDVAAYCAFMWFHGWSTK